jgi:Holliday junction DNA helicase RuvB
MRINIPPFTLIGATTKYGSLSAPLRDRFGDIAKLSFYSSSEMKQIIMRASQILHIEITDEASEILAKCARATPRIANRLLKRLRDFTEIQGDSCITKTHAEKGMRELGVDALGLDHTDRELLEAIIHTFSGGPVGLSTLAAATAEEKETIEEVYEPYLLQIGFLQRSPRGRIATEKAYNHLGILYNTQQNSLF